MNKQVKFKKLSPLAKVPFRKLPTNAGFDIHSIENASIKPGERKAIKTGIAVQGLAGHYIRVAPRSGLALKEGINVLAGVVDESYTGEIMVILHNTTKPSKSDPYGIGVSSEVFFVAEGDRIAQLIFEKISTDIEFVEVEELEETERGSDGFGSSGI